MVSHVSVVAANVHQERRQEGPIGALSSVRQASDRRRHRLHRRVAERIRACAKSAALKRL